MRSGVSIDILYTYVYIYIIFSILFSFKIDRNDIEAIAIFI